jgi:hypothetical protein
MKKLFTIFAFAVILNVNAAVLTVSNNPNSPGQYTTITAAISAASNNDTLYVHASATSYGSFTIGKKLTIIGAGWDGRFYQLGQLKSQVGSITLANVNPNNASGTIIMGLYVNGSLASNSTGVPFVTNVTVDRCFIGGNIGNVLKTSNSLDLVTTNWTIKNCVIDAEVNLQNNGNVVTNCFLNNIRTGTGSSSNIFSNNIFWSFGSSSILNSLNNAIVSNNIFFNSGSSSLTITNAGNGNTYNNNIFFGYTGAIPQGNNSGSNNQINVSPQFINGPPIPTAPVDISNVPNFNWDLQTSSPGQNAGTDGTDIGVFGGASPFNVFAITGITTLPQITQMNINNSTIPVNGILNVNVIAKKRN